jgi:hypothetical protein
MVKHPIYKVGGWGKSHSSTREGESLPHLYASWNKRRCRRDKFVICSQSRLQLTTALAITPLFSYEGKNIEIVVKCFLYEELYEDTQLRHLIRYILYLISYLIPYILSYLPS